MNQASLCSLLCDECPSAKPLTSEMQRYGEQPQYVQATDLQTAFSQHRTAPCDTSFVRAKQSGRKAAGSLVCVV